MENLKYIPRIERREHIITLKDIFAYYDVTKLRGEGNLRITYGRKDKRDLVISIFNVYIAEMFDEFVKGGVVFKFPDPQESTMIFAPIKKEDIIRAKSKGKLKYLDPIDSGFQSVQIMIKTPTKSNNIITTNVLLSDSYQRAIFKKVNKQENLLPKIAKHWNDYMEPIYSIFSKINKVDLDRVILFGLRKMIFFLKKGLEIFLTNQRASDYIYIGRKTNKIKDIDLRYKLLTKQYIKKIRWHAQAQKFRTEWSYYQITPELYSLSLQGTILPNIIFYKLKEEVLIGKPWFTHIMKTKRKMAFKWSVMLQDYDPSEDELIYIKPAYKQYEAK